MYVRDNPVNFLDPSGQIDQGADADRAKIIETYLRDMYQVVVQHDWGPYSITIPASPYTPVTTRDCWQPGSWKITDLELVKEGVDLAAGSSGLQNKAKFLQAMKGRVYISRWNADAGSMAPPPPWNAALGDVVLSNTTFSNTESYAKHVVIHELGHVWDHRTRNALSFGLMQALGTWVFKGNSLGGAFVWDPYANPEVPAGAIRGCTVEQIKNRTGVCTEVPYALTYGAAGALFEGAGWEDWADSFADYVYPDYFGDPRLNVTNLASPGTRRNYVHDQINNVH